MTTLPSNPDELLDLIEDIIFVDLQDFSQLQLHDMARKRRLLDVETEAKLISADYLWHSWPLPPYVVDMFTQQQ